MSTEPATTTGDEAADNAAVDAFAARMKEKLAKKRAEGRSGWQGCAPIDLAKMLIEHLPKGDPVDIANFAMFLGSIDAYSGSVRVALQFALQFWVKEHAECVVRFGDRP